MKTMQKLRDRPNGVNIISLALGEKLSQEEDKLMVNIKIIIVYMCIYIFYIIYVKYEL